MTRIALTGVSGFVEQRLVSSLAAGGYHVRGLLGHDSVSPDREARVELVSGDIRDPGALRDLIEECEVVIHTAPICSSQRDAVNLTLTGVENVIVAARQAGVSRLVYLSHLAAHAASRSALCRALWKAETLVRSSGIPYVTLRPSLVLGRGDGVLRPLYDLIRFAPVVPVPGRGETRCQPIDVGDLVRCIESAVEREDLHDTEISVGGEAFLTFRQLVDLLSAQLDVIKPKLLVPEFAVPLLSRVLPHWAGALYSEPVLAQFQCGVVASPGIVPRMFGFTPASVIDRMPHYLA